VAVVEQRFTWAASAAEVLAEDSAEDHGAEVQPLAAEPEENGKDINKLLI